MKHKTSASTITKVRLLIAVGVIAGITDTSSVHAARNRAGGTSGAALLDQAPATTAVGPTADGSSDALGVGTDRALYRLHYAPQTGWGTWKRLGGILTAPPVLAPLAGGSLDALGVGTDRALYRLHYAPQTGWGTWKRLGGILTAPPVLAPLAGGSLDALGVGTDRALYRLHYAPQTGWGTWKRLGGILTAPPAVTTKAS